jgi:polysaccharide deacetylase family protein (PEP-CTERM system associated)
MTLPETDAMQVILSFDVEEHHRIESAAGLSVPPGWEAHYAERLETSTRWLLEELARASARATFFVLGDLAQRHPKLVRAMHDAGHEVASHGWDHRRLHHLTPQTFRDDVRQGKDALEQIIGAPVVGYRAPTFSVVRQTAWAVDVLVELGMVYDSSIYPVRHDRYGVADAPRWPFRLSCAAGELLELPPMSWRVFGVNLPLGGGGYFRLLPLWMMEAALEQVRRQGQPSVAMLYFHPWEFDPEQRRLPLWGLNRFRTYVGMRSSQRRLGTLLGRHRFTRAADVARELLPDAEQLPLFTLATPEVVPDAPLCLKMTR